MYKNFSKYTDLELVKISIDERRESSAAFLELYNRYSRSVYTFCLNRFYNKNTALEAFEQTFAEFFRAAKSGAEIQNVQPYLFGIAKNLLANHIRSKSRERDYHFIDEDVGNAEYYESAKGRKEFGADEDIEKNIENAELLKLIEDAVELLENEEKEFYKLNKFGGMSASQIAEAFNENINAVKSKIYRAQLKVKEILSPYIEEIKKY